MAWETCKEEAMNVVINKHMHKMRIEKKKEINEFLSQHLFPRQGQNWTNVKWTTHWGVTFVAMWDEEQLDQEHLACNNSRDDGVRANEVLYCLQ